MAQDRAADLGTSAVAISAGFTELGEELRSPEDRELVPEAEEVLVAGHEVRTPADREQPHFANCRSPKIYGHLTTGHHTFEVRALNGVGHGTPATKAFMIS